MCLTCCYSPTGICFDYCRRQDIELGKSCACSIEAFYLLSYEPCELFIVDFLRLNCMAV